MLSICFHQIILYLCTFHTEQIKKISANICIALKANIHVNKHYVDQEMYCKIEMHLLFKLPDYLHLLFIFITKENMVDQLILEIDVML